MKILWLAQAACAPNPAQLMPAECTWQATQSLGEALFELEQERDAFEACIVYLPLVEDDPGAVVEEMLRVKRSLPVVFIRDARAAADAVRSLNARCLRSARASPSVSSAAL
jgi:hypothetical protein